MFVQPYGQLPDGRDVDLYRFGTSQLEVSVMTYGGRVVSLRTPDRRGQAGEAILRYDSLAEYLADTSYLGALIGRYANRISNARFSLGGHGYELVRNDGENSLHGGRRGFDKQLWRASVRGESLSLVYHSAAGEEGYPGGLDVEVLYTVSGNELRIDYSAVPDQETILNLTNHMYFNLGSNSAHQVVGHELILRAGFYTPVTASLVPTGEIRSVDASPFDFRLGAIIGARIGEAHEQLRLAGGYDHNWVLDGEMGALRSAATVYEPISGRRMEVLTSEPGLQFYSGNQLPAINSGARRACHGYRCGLCLETQHFPDSPNHPYFPTTRVEAGQTYRSVTLYRFSAV